MHPKLKLKNKIYITLSVGAVVSLVVLNSIFDVVNCNIKRDYKSGREKFYQEVKEKIQRLEKEEFKDAAAASRLAQQYNLIGTYYLESRLWDMTIDAFNNVLKYGNASDNTFYSLGLAYGNRGIEKNSKEDIGKAEYNYRKATAINPGHLDAKYALAILLFYYKADGKDEAQILINDIIVKNRAHYPARFANGRINYELGNKEKALTLYQELLADINKMPESGLSNDYKAECTRNITRIMSELSMR